MAQSHSEDASALMGVRASHQTGQATVRVPLASGVPKVAGIQ